MKKSLLKIVSFLSSVLLFPVISFAQSGEVVLENAPSGLLGVLGTIQNLLNSAVPVLIALGVVYFVYGVVTYVVASDEEAKKSGKDRIIFGIIGLAVIISLWGLVYVVINTFNLDNRAPSSADLQRLLPR